MGLRCFKKRLRRAIAPRGLWCVIFYVLDLTETLTPGQPILQAMLQKALQAQERYQGHTEAVPLDEAQAEELSIFGGQTRLFNPSPEQTFSPALIPSRPLRQTTIPAPVYPGPSNTFHSAPIHAHCQPTYTQPRPSQSMVPQQISKEGRIYSNSDGRVAPPPPPPVSHGPDTQMTTFADLSGGWDGMFYEVPAPSYGVQDGLGVAQPHQQPVGEGAMVDDRWLSFMHNYGILSEAGQQRR